MKKVRHNDAMFRLQSAFQPTGDQPQAIAQLLGNLKNGARKQTLVGVTGSGKTFTMANVIAASQRPALVISPNKTLAAQLWQEFREFFPNNPVHYFVSYYDYYQPEAYLPATDTYIEKDAKINAFIDRLRHGTTQTLLTEKHFVVVASVSCIYGIGDPEAYKNMSRVFREGERVARSLLLQTLAHLQYERVQPGADLAQGMFRVNGDAIELVTPDGERRITIELFGDTIERITATPTNQANAKHRGIKLTRIFPAKHFVTPDTQREEAIIRIERELEERVAELKKTGKIFESERLSERTRFDVAMLRETGYCSGIENYSRHLARRAPGEPPFTLLDYLPKNTVIFIDESHLGIPQIRGMYEGDRARKRTLVEHGFRLPSALDNRPLRFDEFCGKAFDTVYVSATPNTYERAQSGPHIVEQVVRPTGLLEPVVVVRPATRQIDNLIKELRQTAKKNERALVITLTKRLSEEISEYLREHSIKTEYLHSEIKTLERQKILRDFRLGVFDVLIGINLLREGLDLPEVSLVAILDADKEGFLRNETTLIQTMGRAARHPDGHVILYADRITGSMESAIQQSARRRNIQEQHNKMHGITPQAIVKAVRPILMEQKEMPRKITVPRPSNKKERLALRAELKREMSEAAENLDFERAIELREALQNVI